MVLLQEAQWHEVLQLLLQQEQEQDVVQLEAIVESC